MKKYLLCLFLSILMLVGISAYADGTASGLTWSLSEGVLTISGNGAIPDYSYTSTAPWREADIQSVVIESGVTRVGAWAFDHCSAESISLPDTLTSIGDYSFRCNNNLQNIDIPNGVTEIGIWAFEQCQALESITFPDTLTSIGRSAFYKCAKLQSVVIPASVTVLQDSLFYECWRITSVTFSSNVTAVEDNSFAYCSGLAEVYYKGSAADWNSMTIGNENPYLTHALRHYVYNDNLSWTLVDGVLTITGTGVMPPVSPWSGTEFTSAVIEEGITSIGSQAFRYCESMQTISLPDSLTRIDATAFMSCKALEAIEVPDNVTTIETQAFVSCSSLKQVTFGAGLSSIGDALFRGCSALQTIQCSEDNAKYTSVNGVLFNKSKTMLALFPTGFSGSYVIPTGTTSIRQSAFYFATKLTDITIPEGVTTINMMGFDGCSSLTSVELPSSLKTMGSFASAECTGLTDVVIREGLQTIPSGAFTGCRNLVSVRIPKSVTSIASSAFSSSCKSLNTVFYAGSEADWSSISIGSDNEKLTSAQIYYNQITDGTTSDGYKYMIVGQEATVTGYTGTSTILNIPSSVDGYPVTTISKNAFFDCPAQIVAAHVPETVTKIEAMAFVSCNALRQIIIPSSVQQIDDEAFVSTEYHFFPSDLTIFSEKGSAAEQYAVKNNIGFISLEISLMENQVNYYIGLDFDAQNCGVYSSNNLFGAMVTNPEKLIDAFGDRFQWSVNQTSGDPLQFNWDIGTDGNTYRGVYGYLLQMPSSVMTATFEITCTFGSLKDTKVMTVHFLSAPLPTDVSGVPNEINSYAGDTITLDVDILPAGWSLSGYNAQMFFEGTMDISPDYEWYRDGLNLHVEELGDFDIAFVAQIDTIIIAKEITIHSGQPVWDLVLPADLTAIHDEAFRSIKAETVKIPFGTTSIGKLAFADSNLKAIFIPASVVSISEDALPEGTVIYTAPNSPVIAWAGTDYPVVIVH